MAIKKRLPRADNLFKSTRQPKQISTTGFLSSVNHMLHEDKQKVNTTALTKIDLIAALNLPNARRINDITYHLTIKKDTDNKNSHQYFCGENGDWIFINHGNNPNPDYPENGNNYDLLKLLGMSVNDAIEELKLAGSISYAITKNQQRKNNDIKNYLLKRYQKIDISSLKLSEGEITKEDLFKLEATKVWAFPVVQKDGCTLEIFKYKNGKNEKRFRYTFTDKNGEKSNIFNIKDAKNEENIEIFTQYDKLPYCYEQVRNEPILFITEGEKDCDTARLLGLNAIALAHNSGKAFAHFIPIIKKDFPNISNIIYLSDNDKAGVNKARELFLVVKTEFNFIAINCYTCQVLTKFDEKEIIEEHLKYDFFDLTSDFFVGEDGKELLIKILNDSIETYRNIDFTETKNKEEITEKLLQKWLSEKKLSSHVKINQRYMDGDIFVLSDFLLKNTNKYVGIKAKQGSGKTQSIMKYLSELNKAKKPFILFVTHRNSLADGFSHKIKSEFGVNIQPYSELKNSDVWEANRIDGIALCIDSLEQKHGVDLNGIIERFHQGDDVIVVIDEIEQFIEHYLTAKTEIKNHRCDAVAELALLLRIAAKVIFADADLSDYAVKNIKNVVGNYCGGDDLDGNIALVENEYNENGFEVEWIADKHTFTNLLIKRIIEKKNDLPIAVCTSSQKLASDNSSSFLTKLIEKRRKYIEKKLEKKLKILTIDSQEKKIIDSEISKLGDDWVNKLSEYDIVIMSPSVETGCDIPESIEFDSVWDYAAGNQSPEKVVQHICRVRHTCKRYLYINDRGIKKSEAFTANAVLDELLSKANSNLSLIKNLLDRENKSIENILSGYSNPDELVGVLLKEFCFFDARNNLSSYVYKAAVMKLLQARGHQWESITATSVSVEEKKEIEKKKENYTKEFISDNAKNIFSAKNINLEKAEKIKNKLKNQKIKSEENLELEKFYYRQIFGEKNISKELIEMDISIKKTLKEKLKLGYYLEFSYIFNENEIPLNDKNTVDFNELLYEVDDNMFGYKIYLLNQLGILELIQSEETFKNNSKVIKDLHKKWKKEEKNIKRMFGIKCPKNNSVLKQLNRLLEKIGFGLYYYKKNHKGSRSYFIKHLLDETARYKVYKYFYSQKDSNFVNFLINSEGEIGITDVYNHFYRDMGYHKNNAIYQEIRQRLVSINEKLEKENCEKLFYLEPFEGFIYSPLSDVKEWIKEKVKVTKNEIINNFKNWFTQISESQFFDELRTLGLKIDSDMNYSIVD